MEFKSDIKYDDYMLKSIWQYCTISLKDEDDRFKRGNIIRMSATEDLRCIEISVYRYSYNSDFTNRDEPLFDWYFGRPYIITRTSGVYPVYKAVLHSVEDGPGDICKIIFKEGTVNV